MIRLAALVAALIAPLAACAADPAPRADASSPAEVRILKRAPVDGALLGGLSGLAYDPRNRLLASVSDRGGVFALPLTPEAQPGFIGKLAAPRRASDPEAIRWTPDRGWLVSFESGGAIARYRGDSDALVAPPASALRPQALARLPTNAGVEAMALLDFGRILAIAEGGKGDGRQAWIFDGPTITPKRYPIAGKYEPVDAVMAPNGDVLVLERRFNGFLPPFFSARIARVPAASIDGPDRGLTIAARRDLAGLLPSENWEGLEIVDDHDGAGAALWLVSDDNFQWPQNTLLARMPLSAVLE